jgi:hypothetical protein
MQSTWQDGLVCEHAATTMQIFVYPFSIIFNHYIASQSEYNVETRLLNINNKVSTLFSIENVAKLTRPNVWLVDSKERNEDPTTFADVQL